MKNERILILGATGFIGKKLISKLENDHTDLGLIKWNSESDIADEKIVAAIVNEKPSIILVAAGKSFVPDSWKQPLDFFRINTVGTLNIAEAARLCGAKIVFLSTFVYGEPYRLPIKEKNAVRPFNPYASSKFLAEQTLKDYYRFFGVQSNVLRVFNVYGQGQRNDFLIPTLIEQYKTKAAIHVKDLKPKRDYIHIDDLVDAIIASMKKFQGFEVYNAASGNSYSVEEVIGFVCKAGGKMVPVSSDEQTRTNEVMDTKADISKIASELNWVPQIEFEAGIRELVLTK
ncbi:MAG: NAD(P)-dependent oxidoreductase [Crocinitomicaceae bacterium]|nr:NAD(P)-dependent oxidoreductase [Crocinitomicaceae bacterium]